MLWCSCPATAHCTVLPAGLSKLSMPTSACNTMISAFLLHSPPADHRVVQWLWQVVGELTQEERKLFLKFFTGSDRAPIGGLGNLRCIIQVRPDECGLVAG